jgi:hypothetical protein|tara:strand:+ start:746 stop:910 length:165 start_codon:yes stop_codon:yes gene_type:complete
MDIDNLHILMQYISSLEEASARLERAYLNKNQQQVEEIKKFILDIKSKVDLVLQ